MMRFLHLTALAAMMSLTTVACDHTGTAPERVSTAMDAHMHHRPSAGATTSASIAMHNLDAVIAGLERRLEKSPGNLRFQEVLLSNLVQRSSALGRFDDLDRIAKLGDDMVAGSPDNPKAHIGRARALAARHLFADAFAELDKARELGATEGELEELRASLLGGTGRFQEALDIMQRRAAIHPNINALGYIGHLLGRLGRHDEAEAAFQLAEQSYRDVSPFVLATLYFEWGLMRHEADDEEGAKEMYRATLERLPLHAHASVHLAELAGEQEGILVLERLLAQVNEPEGMGLMAELLEERDHARSAEWLARAKKRYTELSARHPLAFADHAGWFWLGPGGNAHKALKKAELNLTARQNDEAYALYLESALALGHHQQACAAADKALAPDYVRPSLRKTAAEAYRACGRSDDANKTLRGDG